MLMRALDQFSRFFAIVASGLTGARHSPEPGRDDGGRNETAAADSQPSAQPTAVLRQEKLSQPPRVSHTAVWPR